MQDGASKARCPQPRLQLAGSPLWHISAQSRLWSQLTQRSLKTRLFHEQKTDTLLAVTGPSSGLRAGPIAVTFATFLRFLG